MKHLHILILPLVTVLGTSCALTVDTTGLPRAPRPIGKWYGTMKEAKAQITLVLEDGGKGKLGFLKTGVAFEFYRIHDWQLSEDILCIDLINDDTRPFKDPAANPDYRPFSLASNLYASYHGDKIVLQYTEHGYPPSKGSCRIQQLDPHELLVRGREALSVTLKRNRSGGRYADLLDSFVQYHDSSKRTTALISLLRAKIGTDWNVRWDYDVNGPGYLEGTVNLERVLSPTEPFSCDNVLDKLSDLLSLCGIDSSSLSRRYPRGWFDERTCNYDQVYSGVMVYNGDTSVVTIEIVPTEIRETYRIRISSSFHQIKNKETIPLVTKDEAIAVAESLFIARDFPNVMSIESDSTHSHTVRGDPTLLILPRRSHSQDPNNRNDYYLTWKYELRTTHHEIDCRSGPCFSNWDYTYYINANNGEVLYSGYNQAPIPPPTD